MTLSDRERERKRERGGLASRIIFPPSKNPVREIIKYNEIHFRAVQRLLDETGRTANSGVKRNVLIRMQNRIRRSWIEYERLEARNVQTSRGKTRIFRRRNLFGYLVRGGRTRLFLVNDTQSPGIYQLNFPEEEEEEEEEEKKKRKKRKIGELGRFRR